MQTPSPFHDVSLCESFTVTPVKFDATFHDDTDSSKEFPSSELCEPFDDSDFTSYKQRVQQIAKDPMRDLYHRNHHHILHFLVIHSLVAQIWKILLVSRSRLTHLMIHFPLHLIQIRNFILGLLWGLCKHWLFYFLGLPLSVESAKRHLDAFICFTISYCQTVIFT